MTLQHLSLHVNDFEPQVSGFNRPLIDAVISDHDAGTVTTLDINYEWRRLISALIEPLLNPLAWDGTESEIDDAIQKMQALYNDLYD